MKWAILAVTGIVLFVMVFFGMQLISNEQQTMSSMDLADPGYQDQIDTTNILYLGVLSAPVALFVLAIIAILSFLAYKSGMF